MYKLVFILFLLFEFQNFDHVSFQMTQRRNIQGKTSRHSAKMYFTPEGKMVAHYYSPIEFFMINNKEGELTLYNPQENSVYQTMNNLLSSQNNPIYFFMSGNTEDMGLKKMGYTLKETKIDDGLLVSYFQKPASINEEFSMVELVHKGRNPVFLGYLDDYDKYVKKVFYYDFKDFQGFSMPQSITEIEYFESDSSIAKTTFDTFQFNNSSDKEILDFQVPENAKVIK